MSADRPRVLDLLKRHGWNATSFQVLEEGFVYAFDSVADDGACVAYAETAGAWVVAGGPIAREEALAGVTERFLARAREARRRVTFFAVEDRFLAVSNLSSIPVGEQPTWDPSRWDESLRSSKSLREQVRRARSKGVVARSLDPRELEDEASPARRAVEAVISRWLASRGMAPMGFLVDVQPFAFGRERRYIVAEREGRVVAFLAAVPVYARGGWLLEDLIRDPTAPNGTAELVVDAAMRALADEGSHYVTMGLAPLAGAVGWMRLVRDSLRALYDFEGVRSFKAKLKPHAWEPIHLAYARESSPNVALFDTLAVFARGSFTRFGAETLLHGPAIVVRTLGALLLPWTTALAFTPTRFFPFPWVRTAWVVFDAALALGLFALAARWRFWLGRVLACAVAVDTWVTWVEALLWNLERDRTLADRAVIAVACVVPALALVILLGGLGHRAWMKSGPPQLDAPDARAA